MSDRLKQYVNHKLDDFELYPFSNEEGWEGVRNSIRMRSGLRRKRWWMAAASGFFILFSVWMGLGLIGNAEEGDEALREAQFYYQELIDSKLFEVKQKVEDPKLFEDLDDLDLAFAELKNDLNDDVQNEEVVSAMIDHYRLKLKILERILEELEEEQDEVDRSS